MINSTKIWICRFLYKFEIKIINIGKVPTKNIHRSATKVIVMTTSIERDKSWGMICIFNIEWGHLFFLVHIYICWGCLRKSPQDKCMGFRFEYFRTEKRIQGRFSNSLLLKNLTECFYLNLTNNKWTNSAIDWFY